MLAELIDWSIALVPVLLMAMLFSWLDVFKLMSKSEMLALLLIGSLVALLAWPVSGRMLDTLPIGYSFYSRFVAPWIEEALKGLAVALLFLSNRIGYKLDAIISGFAVGAGFSVVENILYLVRFSELPVSVWLVRGLGTAVMHGAATALLAALAHGFAERTLRAEGRRGFNPLWLVPGYVVAGLFHLLFNQFPDYPTEVMLATLAIAPALLVGVMHFGEREAHRWLEEESQSHRLWLAQWENDGFPDDPSGQRIKALCERVSTAEAGLIRDYCRLKTQLVLIAEEELFDRDRKLEQGESERVRSLLARLGRTERDLGRAGQAALRPLLPFSRNDDWELSELRELIERD